MVDFFEGIEKRRRLEVFWTGARTTVTNKRVIEATNRNGSAAVEPHSSP